MFDFICLYAFFQNGHHSNGNGSFTPSTSTVKKEPSLSAKTVTLGGGVGGAGSGVGGVGAAESPKKKKTNGCCSVM